MTTVMAEKLAAAGVKVPTEAERLWNVIRDNPRITSARASELAAIKSNNASTITSLMYNRGMLSRDFEERRVPIYAGRVATKRVAVYSTVYKTFEMLPPPKKPKVTKTPTPPPAATPTTPDTPSAPSAPSVASPLRKTPTVADAEQFVERMTIAEARAVWAVLDRMFGGSE